MRRLLPATAFCFLVASHCAVFARLEEKDIIYDRPQSLSITPAQRQNLQIDTVPENTPSVKIETVDDSGMTAIPKKLSATGLSTSGKLVNKSPGTKGISAAAEGAPEALKEALESLRESLKVHGTVIRGESEVSSSEKNAKSDPDGLRIPPPTAVSPVTEPKSVKPEPQ